MSKNHSLPIQCPKNAVFLYIFAQKISIMSAQFMQLGYDSATSIGIAQGKLYGQLIQQSTLSAFINAYRIYAVLILILIPLVFVLKRFNPEK